MNREAWSSKILEIARGVSVTTGDSFFLSLVDHLARTLGAAYVLIGEIDPRQAEGPAADFNEPEVQQKVRTIAAYAHGRMREPAMHNPEFHPGDTLVAQVLRTGTFSCISSVKERFPKDEFLQRTHSQAAAGIRLVTVSGKPLGLIVVIFPTVLESAAEAELMLQIFAVRAAAELERRQMMARLEASERRFRALIEHSAEGLIIVSPEGVLLYISPSSDQIIGFSPEYHLGKHFSELIHPDEVEAAEALFTEIFKSPGAPVPFRFRRILPNGELHWIEGSANNLLGEPAISGIVLNFRDVTLRITAEERLRASEERFRAMAENIQDGLTIIQSGQIVYTNQRMAEIAGRPYDELFNLTGFDFAAPEEQERLRRLQEDARQKGQLPNRLSFWVLRKDGTRRYIQNRYSIIKRTNQQVDRYVVTTDITDQKLAEEELRFRAEFEALIIGISTRLINVRTGQMMHELSDALSEVGAFTQVDRCHIFRFDEGLNTIDCIAEWAREGMAEPHLPDLQKRPVTLSTFWHRQIRAHQPFILSSLDEIPGEEDQLRQVFEWMGIKSMIDVPILSDGRLVGILGLSSVRQERSWTKEEVALLNLLAEIIANALARRESEALIDRQLQNLSALHTIDKTITTKTELGPILKVLLEQIRSQLSVDAAEILLYNAPAKELQLGDACGFHLNCPASAPEHLQNTLLRRAIEKRETQRLRLPAHSRGLFFNEPFAAYYCVPLVARGAVNGVLELFYRNTFEANSEWLRFLNMLAEQAAIAIDNVTMFQTLEHSNEELSQAYDATIEGWARALELRDQETEGHSRRVPHLALLLGQELGLDGDALVHLRRGALLHDIGKMGIPDTILFKRDQLEPNEWEIMRQHPLIAYNLLSSIPFLRPALDIPYCHHERWDGAGYPRGLKGDEIPLAARIFTVVDVWDALRTTRRYRQAWDEQQVCQYFLEEAGKQLDPQVVQAFLRMLDAGLLDAGLTGR